MKLSMHFCLEEFLQSTTATTLQIENIPDHKAEHSIVALVVNLLQPLRNAYGSPIKITSGYRSILLNRHVGGKPHSQHLRGEAADLVCNSPQKLLQTLQIMNIDFDQAILYPHFLHLSYTTERPNRREVIKK